MRIANLLAAKGSSVATIPPSAAIQDAISSLADHGIGALVVSTDGRHVEGILSERDVVRALGEQPKGLLQASVSSIMSASVRTCSLADDTDALMAVMTEHRIRHVPVLDNGELAGIVSIGDIVKARIVELEKDRKELVDYINAR